MCQLHIFYQLCSLLCLPGTVIFISSLIMKLNRREGERLWILCIQTVKFRISKNPHPEPSLKKVEISQLNLGHSSLNKEFHLYSY